jgi:hypothetical protein
MIIDNFSNFNLFLIFIIIIVTIKLLTRSCNYDKLLKKINDFSLTKIDFSDSKLN